MAVADEFTDLVKLNAYIGRRFVKTLNDKSVVVRGGFQNFRETDGLERISSSGNKFDCLIHSFLTATCPNFRLLDKADKDYFADMYRRIVFIYIAQITHAYSEQSKREQESIKRRIRSIEFLENIEITILCEYYHIKMLVFEVLVGVPSVVLYGLNSRINADNDDVYMIYNPGQGHFEAVRVKGTDNYSIPFSGAEISAETLRLIHPLPDGPAAVAAPERGWTEAVAAPEQRWPAVAYTRNLGSNAILKKIGNYPLTENEINKIFDTYSRNEIINGMEIGKILLAMNLDKDIIKRIVKQARGNTPGRQYPEKKYLNREEFIDAIKIAENVLTLPWLCKVCGRSNLLSAKTCEFCDNPKPSSGGRRKTRGKNKKRGTRKISHH